MTEKERIICELSKELRGIISSALNKRSDTQRLKDSGYGDYIQENTDTMMEIEKDILETLENIE